MSGTLDMKDKNGPIQQNWAATRLPDNVP